MKLALRNYCIIIFCVLSIQQCKPDDPCDPNQIPLNETYYLSIDEKQKIPFFKAEFDSLVYVSDKGDTAVLYKQPVKNYLWKASWNRNAHPGCQLWDVWNHDTYEFEFKGKHPSLSYINFKVSTHDGFRGEGSKASYVYYQIITNENFNVEAYFDYVNYTLRYIDTVKINSNIYAGVTMFGAKPDKLKFTYNYQFGILKITTNNLIWIKQ